MIALFLMSGAQAADVAEAERLREELLRLTQRNTWAGVDRTYRDLVALGVPLTAAEHVMGGTAAVALGDPMLAWYRFRRAPPPGPVATEEELGAFQNATQEADNIEARYGKVALCVGPQRLPILVRQEMPFAQQERDAIQGVVTRIRDERCFRGLLPVGPYQLDGQDFEVVAGGGWVVVDLGW